jgi:hypothetical protein
LSTHRLFIIKGDLVNKYRGKQDVDIHSINESYVEGSIEAGELDEISKIFNLSAPWEKEPSWIYGLSDVADVWTKKDCLIWWEINKPKIKEKLAESSYWIVVIPKENICLIRKALRDSSYNVRI